MSSFCDLHTHSHFSDGTYSPTEIIKEAKARGLSAVALCDHNTTEGLAEFVNAASDTGVKAITGMEFSTGYNGIEVHILALYVSPCFYEEIEAMLKPMHDRKDESNRRMLEALKRDGIDLSDKIDAGRAKHINRAHVAEALYKCGLAESIKDAFKKYLAPGGKYYTPPTRPDVKEIVEYINKIGAVSVLAHPYLTFHSEDEIRELLSELVPSGLDAMEVYYSTYDEITTDKARALAEEYSLLESGGSDFHGTKKPTINLGTGYGELKIPSTKEVALFERAVLKKEKK